MRGAAAMLGAVFWPCLIAAASAAPPSIYPSGDRIPANLLRISVEFPTPLYKHAGDGFSLTHDDGTAIQDSLYEQLLESPDGRTVTVYLNPGRVKSGLPAHDALGWALHANENVQLRWNNHVLTQWTVGAPQQQSIEINEWEVTVPKAGTLAPLRVRFSWPIDWQARHLIAVQGSDGTRVAGSGTLVAHETRWEFTPLRAWTPGIYRLRVHPELEDAAGNRVGSSFDEKELSTEHATGAARSFSIQ